MNVASGTPDAERRAETLVRLFHPDPSRFGRLRQIAAEQVPDIPRGLLAHHSHMTVAMERFHGGPVTLRVIAERFDTAAGGMAGYAREIALLSAAGRMVQVGIVRIELDAVSPDTAATIRTGREPLGRILIDAGLLREVADVRLLEIEPGPDLRAVADWPAEARERVFGRVAVIRLDMRPAVELLEIVTAVAP